MPNENSPLLGRSQSNGGLDHPAKTFRPLKSSWYLIKNSWLNVLLVTVPVTIAGESIALRNVVITLSRWLVR